MDGSKRTPGRDRVAQLSALLATIVFLTVGGQVEARGTARVDKTVVEEKDGEWKLKFTIDYGGEPHLGHIPMIFSFKQTATYERSTDDSHPDKDHPVERKIAMSNAAPINLPMDVGFADMSGKMFKITKFDMKLNREADFEAGEYELTIKPSEGGTIGGVIRLQLKGKNKVINRGSINIEAKPPSPKKAQPKEAASDGSSSKPKAAEDYSSDQLSGIDDISDEEAAAIHDPTAAGEVEPKQGGCGCRVVGERDGVPWYRGLLLLGMLPVATTLRRRRCFMAVRAAAPRARA